MHHNTPFSGTNPSCFCGEGIAQPPSLWGGIFPSPHPTPSAPQFQTTSDATESGGISSVQLKPVLLERSRWSPTIATSSVAWFRSASCSASSWRWSSDAGGNCSTRYRGRPTWRYSCPPTCRCPRRTSPISAFYKQISRRPCFNQLQLISHLSTERCFWVRMCHFFQFLNNFS